jgi:phosphatidylethanolamine-binding protein (PEBP) family uncharacterized protein
MAWEEDSCICLNMQLIAILSRIGVINESVYARTHNKYAYKGPSPPSGSDFFRIHVFPFIVIQKDKQRLAVHWTWKNKPFSLFIQKS